MIRTHHLRHPDPGHMRADEAKMLLLLLQQQQHRNQVGQIPVDLLRSSQ